MRKKIVIVGAGSAVFTKGLLLDLLEHKGGSWHAAMVDTDPEALSVAHALAKKMAARFGSDIELSASTDRCDVLAGAHYVVSVIGVGGRRAWEQDVFIPREYGIFQPVGDTVGVGGVSRAMRMIPQLVGIAGDIEKYCKDALFFNYSNPMTMNCMAVRRATGVPVVGLCHGVKNGVRRVARFLQRDHTELSYTACGLNHMVFLYGLRAGGRDLFPDFIRRLDSVPRSEREIGLLTEEFVRDYNTYVVSDDRHFSEFVPETLLKDAYFGGTLGVSDYSFEETISEGDKEFESYRAAAASELPLPDSFFDREDGEHEQLLDIISAIQDDHPAMFYANLPNNGAVAGLPDDTVIERPALFSASGVQPLQMTDFPVKLIPRLSRHAGIYDLAVTAALEGDAQLFRLAIAESCPSLSRAQASALAERLLAAHKAYLPQFN